MPSFKVEFVESVPEKWTEDDVHREQIKRDLQEGDREDDSHHTVGRDYIHCRDVDKYPEHVSVIDCWEMTADEWKDLLDNADGDQDKAFVAATDACREYIDQKGLY